MLHFIFDNPQITHSAKIIISLAILLFSGFLFTRITKLFKLPNVTAYIIAGVVIGPSCLSLIPQTSIDNMDFVTDIALSFIAFGVGEYFKVDIIKKQGIKIIIITLFESLIAALLVTFSTYYLFHLDFSFCLILGAIASATAPASTIMTIRQTKSEGEFVDTLLQVVALDDAVSLVAFSVAVAFATASISGADMNIFVFIEPVIINLFGIIFGIIFGLLLHLFISKKRTTDNRLIIGIAFIISLSGICSVLSISPLLSCMALGTTYINVSKNTGLFKQINYFSPPIFLLFFVLSGMRLKVDTLLSLGIIGVFYFVIRIVGKYIGAILGCKIAKTSKSTRNFLGLGLIPQAGVSIGLAALGARILDPFMGEMLTTIILSSSILYEMIGPISAKFALFLSHSYQKEKTISKEIK